MIAPNYMDFCNVFKNNHEFVPDPEKSGNQYICACGATTIGIGKDRFSITLKTIPEKDCKHPLVIVIYTDEKFLEVSHYICISCLKRYHEGFGEDIISQIPKSDPVEAIREESKLIKEELHQSDLRLRRERRRLNKKITVRQLISELIKLDMDSYIILEGKQDADSYACGVVESTIEKPSLITHLVGPSGEEKTEIMIQRGKAV
jgi:hypothetical protein